MSRYSPDVGALVLQQGRDGGQIAPVGLQVPDLWTQVALHDAPAHELGAADDERAHALDARPTSPTCGCIESWAIEPVAPTLGYPDQETLVLFERPGR